MSPSQHAETNQASGDPGIMETGYGRTCRGGYLRLSQMQQLLYHQRHHCHDEPAAKSQRNGAHPVFNQTFQICV